MLRNLPISRSAQFDATGRYRYRLTRQWQPGTPRPLAIIMLNPSRADASVDDPTIRRCMGLANGWGFGAIIVVNLFAYCTAHPRQLKQVEQPIGAENDASLLAAAEDAKSILLAWGNWGSLHQRDVAVLKLLSPFQKKYCCLGCNRTGQPRHPLYVPGNIALVPWAGSGPNSFG